MKIPPFLLERWQSLYEHEVRYNLSESGVLPLTVAETIELARADIARMPLGYSQTNGTSELRAAIASLYRGADEDNVLATSGSAEANFLALWKLIEPGDRVVILIPTYGQTPGLAQALGARVDAFTLDERLGWQPAPGAASDAIDMSTRLVVVTNPANPTGSVLAADAVAEIVESAVTAGAWLLADEVYVGAEADARETPSFWGQCERAIVTGSLSKAYGLPGLRLGWLVGPPSLVEGLWAAKDYTTIAPSAISDRLATAALRPDARARILRRTRDIILRNRAVVDDWIDGTPLLKPWVLPRAGAIGFVPYTPAIGSSQLAERLRQEADVLVVPGDHFGMDGYLRIGFGQDSGELEEALPLITRELEREAERALL